MKKIILFITILILSTTHAQNKPKQKVVTIVDGQVKQFDRNSKDYKPLDMNKILLTRILKDSIDYNKYPFKSPVIIVVTKSYILNEFYRIALEKNPMLKKDIPSADYLLKIDVVSKKADNIEYPYNHFYKYVYTNDIKETVAKFDSIVYVKPEEAVKKNPKWTHGVLGIIHNLPKKQNN